MKFSMVSAATAAFFSSASAVSTFAVVNRCDIDIYLWSVAGGEAPSNMFTLPANSPHIGYSEKYRYVSQFAGVSIKVAPYYVGDGEIPPPFMNITQLEYTVPPPQNNDPNIWYDLSMVNGNSLMGIPFTYSPSSPGPANCVTGSCSGNYAECSAGYNFPTDDDHTHACPFSQDIIFTFCDGNAQNPLKVPTGQLSCGSSSCTAAAAKREVQPEPVPEPETQPTADADADPLAVCFSAAAAQAGEGVPVFAALCSDTASPPVATSATSSTSSSTSSTTTPASTPSAVAALQQPAPVPTTTSSSSSAAPVATPSAAAAAPAAPAGPPTSPLSALQLSSLPNTGVTCWLSVESSNSCDVASRSLPEKRTVHEHSHRHNHQAFHRRNRIIKSAA